MGKRIERERTDGAAGTSLESLAKQRTSKRHVEIKKVKSHQKARVLRKYNKILKEVGRESDISFVPFKKRHNEGEQNPDEVLQGDGDATKSVVETVHSGKPSPAKPNKTKGNQGRASTPKSAAPAEAMHEKYLSLQQEREQQRRKMEEEQRLQELEREKRQKQKLYEKKKHMERTKRGQPVMKNILDGLLKKIN